jgi:nucleotidyltransferase substrate binding protein (TIGR01987 family)
MNFDKDIRWRQRFKNFEKALKQLEEAVERYDSLSVLEKEGMVKRFEYTFELAWKTLKDYLESQEVIAKFPRDVVKQSFQYELIEDGELWMDMLERRNEMAHTYDESNLKNSVDLIINKYYFSLDQSYQFLKEKF